MGRNVKVILQPVKFRKRNHLAILSPNSPEVDEVVRKFEEAEWSTGYRFWHIPLQPTTVKEITTSLKGIATVDSSAFKNFIYEKPAKQKTNRKKIKTDKPSKEQQEKLVKFKNEFAKKGYSSGTIKVYLSMLNIFFGWYKTKKDTEIERLDVSNFLVQYIEQNKLSINYKRLMTNSLRRYFDYIKKPEITKKL